jgi:hypothetical protein
MSAIHYIPAGDEKETSSPECKHQDLQERVHSLVVVARNILIGVLCAMIAFGLHHMFKALLFGRKLNY